MANKVFANMMEVSCKAGAGKSICAFPDVCFTPPQTPATPPGVPIPYPNTGMSSDTTSGSTSVKVSGQEVMLKNKSYYKRSTGDEAGCAPKKGVITSTNMGKVYFTAWSMDVKVEGENVVRHFDLTTHNHNPPPGQTPPWPNIESINPNQPQTSKPCDKTSCRTDVGDQRYERLRKATPNSAARKQVNKKWPRTCAACGQAKRRLAADHIFPLFEMTALPGFACLPYKEQKRIANHPSNFVGLCKSCNSSKGSKTWKDWKGNPAPDKKIRRGVKSRASEASREAKKQLAADIRAVPC
ncbi:MAG: DUF4150 domain-containing protein [Betaproteobacteria bacterium]|nr:DUF4150 domain-containing protein [Betaproteobacteria bacterium]MCC6247274.1 DUF4150 domain-containing protein [Rubrivivax sp.]